MVDSHQIPKFKCAANTHERRALYGDDEATSEGGYLFSRGCPSGTLACPVSGSAAVGYTFSICSPTRLARKGIFIFSIMGIFLYFYETMFRLAKTHSDIIRRYLTLSRHY